MTHLFKMPVEVLGFFMKWSNPEQDMMEGARLEDGAGEWPGAALAAVWKKA